MIKAKIAPQEEIPQEEMTAPIDDTLAQKIYKAVEDQDKALKKMGSHLSKLEESEIKKPVHIEISEEEEKEDWDERDKSDYERNEQFEKLTTDTMAMKDGKDATSLLQGSRYG